MSKSKKGKSKVRISLPFVLLFFVLVVLCWLLYSSLSAGSQSNETSIATQTTVTTASTQTSTQHTTAATTAENSTTVANTAAPANATVSEQSDNNDATDLYLNNFKAVPSDSKISASDISVGLNILVNNDYAYNFDQSTDFIRLSNLPNRAFKIMFDHITAEKQNITGVNPEAWHFRQVGVPHADYIMKNGICYEEYIDLIKGYSYENPLVINADSGGTYYVYYKAMSSDSTEINLSGYSKYYSSGNNVDGFIVTAVK
ncbi:MAG: hypothetical protein II366_04020 [Clostridia bacterium]|nr:hypothetical protein [Clostridia bacterium]